MKFKLEDKVMLVMIFVGIAGLISISAPPNNSNTHHPRTTNRKDSLFIAEKNLIMSNRQAEIDSVGDFYQSKIDSLKHERYLEQEKIFNFYGSKYLELLKNYNEQKNNPIS